METMTQNKVDTKVSLMELPILKHFDEAEIKLNANNTFKAGEKPIFNILKLGVLAAAVFGFVKYAAPYIFQELGMAIGLVLAAATVVGAIIFAPTYVRWMRKLAKNVHKTFIKDDPFGQLAIERQKMVQNQQVFRLSKGSVGAIENDMQVESNKSENDVKTFSDTIVKLQKKAIALKTSLDEMLKTNGVKAKEDDKYVNTNSDLMKVLSESDRISHQLEQSKLYVQKYGARAAIMKKFRQKLMMVETSMDIKLADFDATVEMLKKDYAFGQKARAATDAAKSAMGFTKGWELDYALDVVTTTIANDIAITAGNIRDIDTLTANAVVDSDDLYANLNTLADNIKVGKSDAPTAKQYTNPEYQLTESDKRISGGFQDLM